MSNVSYDLDTSGGLMPLIKALIKPPDEEVTNQKTKKPQHPYYKRPGKGHNRDSCDACGEGGDLICCDRCPASFHLGCYDPPLDENDIPVGLWLCRECLGADAEQAPSSRGSRAVSPADTKSDTERKTRSLRNRSNSTKKTEEDDKEKETKDKEKEEKELSPMEILVKAARVMNPRQFELPREMRVPCPFPGTDKENGSGSGKNGNSKNGNGSLVTVDSWGCVPLPARACFVCAASCKQAPLLACDYCPLLFHQDCLDPPLTALPTGRWMCPNHVEQYIDWKLVNSVSATERVALWERFAAPPDQHAVTLAFLRQARAGRPFRQKVAVAAQGRVLVPGMVRAHYACPPPLQPGRREYVRCRRVLQNQQATSDYDASDDEDDKPKHVICLNLSCPQHSGGRCPHQLRGASDQDAADDLKAIADPKEEPSSSSEHSDSDFEYEAPVKRRRSSPSGEDALRAVDAQLRRLGRSLVRLLAWQRLQQILAGEQCHGPWARRGLGAAAAAAVRRGLARARLARRGGRPAPLPSDLLGRAERERIAARVWGAPPPPPPPAPPATPATPDTPAVAELVLRAAVCPVLRPDRAGLGDGLGQPIGMRLSRLSFGSDSGCDVVLDASRCRYVSGLHATIFYDEVTQHFELINYSEWGSRVDGVLYCADAAARAPPAPREPGGELRAQAVRDVVRRRLPRTSASGRSELPACRCVPPAALGAGAWEGSALVAHGALLQLGCLLFVFSAAGAGAGDTPDDHPE